MPQHRKTGTREERGGSCPCTPRAAPRTPPPPKPPSAENVGSRRSRFWRHLPLPSSRESPPRRRGRLRPTSSPPPSPFPLPFLSSGRAPPPPSSSSILPPPCLCAPPAATGWEARPPPPREGGGGASRGGHPRLRRGTRSEAPRRPCIWPRHAGAASAPPSRGPRGLASSRGGGGKGESRARCGTAPGEKAGRTPAAVSSSCFSPTALWRPERLPDRQGFGLARPEARKGLS